jgi:hypothetical protein
VKKLEAEEEIKARLRELTAETRRVREELQGMIRQNAARSIAEERPHKRRRRRSSKKR